MKIAAVIFDLDGTIIEDEREWSKAYANVLKNLGADVSEGNTHIFGASTKSNLESQISKYKIKTAKTIDELVALTFREVQKFIPEMSLNDGVLDFMEALKESGLSLSLATSSDWETTDKILEHFRLRDFFENITTIEEVEHPKPAPDIYLLVSEKLGVDPGDCLVIEDSPPGVIAAKEAEMKVVAINDDEEKQINLGKADLVVSAFTEITMKAIDSL